METHSQNGFPFSEWISILKYGFLFSDWTTSTRLKLHCEMIFLDLEMHACSRDGCVGVLPFRQRAEGIGG